MSVAQQGAPTPVGVGAAGPGSPHAGPMHGLRARWPVLAFLGRRILAGIATLLAASILIFLATNALPGNVAEAVLGHTATPEMIDSLNQELGLDQPITTRYVDWLGGVVTGDLGDSAVAAAQGKDQTSVASLISTPLRNSIILALIAFVLLVPLSLLLGTAAAVRAGRRRDYAISYTSLVLGALPEFVLGTMLIVIFFSVLDWLPPVVLLGPGESPLSEPDALILPVATLLGVVLAFCVRQVRAGVLVALHQDCVPVARLGGIKERRVLWRYAVRNALAPSVQTFGQALMYLFGGIIVVESLFNYPGIGLLMVQSVSLRDVTMVQSIAFVLAAAFIAINILTDLLAVLLVPKLRTGLR